MLCIFSMINDCEIFPNFRVKLYWEAWCVVPLLGWAERRNKSARLSFNLQTAGQQRGICKSVVNLHELFCLQFGGVQQTGDHWWLLWRPSNMSPAIMNITRCLQSDTCCRMGSQVHCTAQWQPSVLTLTVWYIRNLRILQGCLKGINGSDKTATHMKGEFLP